MTRPAFLGCAALGVAMLVASGARAQPERVAVVGLGLFGSSVSPSLQAALRLSLVGGLEGGGFEVLPEDEIARKTERTPALRSCETMTCLRSLAEQLQVKMVVRARVDAVQANDYIINLYLVDPFSERVLRHVEDKCQVCTTAEAKESVSNAAHLLGTSRDSVESKPRLEAESLHRDANLPVEKRRSRRWKLWLGVGLGAAAIVTGVVVGVAVAETSGGTDFWSRGQKGCTSPSCQVGDYRP
jgi:hypothetical protein